jgi:hypothetical protein
MVDRKGLSASARELGIDRDTLRRAASGRSLSTRTITALARIAPRVRTEDEFSKGSGGGATAIAPPRPTGPYVWDLSRIRAARDAQIAGMFSLAVRLAEAMRTDDALFNAYHNRIAPLLAVATKLVAAEGARGESVKNKAASSCFVARSVLAGIHGTLVNHGIAIGQIEREANEDGTRIDFRLTEWPLEHVTYHPSTGELRTAVRWGASRTILHGDGEWIVFRKFHELPWTQDACLLPGALCYAAHAGGIKDWAGASRSHGLAKILGKMAEGVDIKTEDTDELSPEARDFLAMLLNLQTGEDVVGIAPPGSSVEFVSNGSTQWQIFTELVTNREKAAARIYLGTDAVLGSVGGAPGVDISALFAIASTKLQSDAEAIEQGLRTGFYEPWCAINEGDSRYAPWFRYELPDPDKAQTAEQRGARRKLLLDLLKQYADQGFTVDQGVIDRLAKELSVSDPPKISAIAERAVPVPIAPTDYAKAVTINEVRRSIGLPNLPGDSGNAFLAVDPASAKIETPPAPAAPAAPAA